MNPKERFLLALSGGKPDRVPTWELVIDQSVIRGILQEEARALSDLDSYILLAEKLVIEGLTAFEVMNYEPSGDGILTDEWGINYKVGEEGEKFPVDGPIKNQEDLLGYSPPDPNANYRWNTLEKLKSHFGDDRAVGICVHDSFEYSWFLRGGMDEFLLDFYRNPSFIGRLTEMVVDYNCSLVKAGANLGADFVVSGDDYAYKSGLLMSPGHYEEFLLPGLKRLIDFTHREGLPFLKHTDGNVNSLLPLFVEAEIDGLCPLEPVAGMNLGEVKKQYGDEFALVGNVDVSNLLPFGTQKRVRSEVKRCLELAASGGGYILSSSNTIHSKVEPDNYLAMLQALRDFGSY